MNPFLCPKAKFRRKILSVVVLLFSLGLSACQELTDEEFHQVTCQIVAPSLSVEIYNSAGQPVTDGVYTELYYVETIEEEVEFHQNPAQLHNWYTHIYSPGRYQLDFYCESTDVLHHSIDVEVQEIVACPGTNSVESIVLTEEVNC